MRVTSYMGLLALLCATWQVQAAEPPAIAAACAQCHGKNGEGSLQAGAPALAGQEKGYLTRQLQAFRQGARGGHVDDRNGQLMREQARALKETDIPALAEYFAAQPALAQPVGNGDAKRGQAAFTGNCAACHGPRGEGYAQLGVPNLRILDASYLRRQIEAYHQGWRGGDESAGQYALWMRSIANTVDDPQRLDDIQSYLGSLR